MTPPTTRHRPPFAKLALLASALALVASTVSQGMAAMVPAGPEFGPFGEEPTKAPHVCARAGGGYVLAYSSFSPELGPAVWFLDETGAPIGGKTDALGSQVTDVISLSCAANGDFYLAWREGLESFGRRYDATGAPLGVPVAFSLPAGTFIGKIVLAPDGSVVVAGTNDSYAASPVVLRVFAADGTALSPETTTGVTSVDYEVRPYDLSFESDGDFVVARGNIAQRFDALGNQLTPATNFDFDIPGETGWIESRRRLCRQPSGNLVIVGNTDLNSGDAQDVYARIFDSDIQPLGAAFVVSSDVAGPQHSPVVVCGADGGFVVAWHDSESDLVARRFDATGSPLGGDFHATDERRGSQGEGGTVGASSGSHYLIARHDLTELGDASDSRIRVRGYCDDADIGCTYVCPGSVTDTDADGYPDTCDPCTNVAGAQTTESAMLRIKRKHHFAGLELARFSAISFRGEVAFPPGLGGFAAIDPLTQAIRVRVEGVEDTTIVDSTLPTTAYAGVGTAGWTSRSEGNVWEYRSREEFPREGIVGVRMTSLPGDYVRVVVKSIGVNYSGTVDYPFRDFDLPLRVIVAFGPEAVTSIGGCTETDFSASDCSYSEVETGMRTLRCR